MSTNKSELKMLQLENLKSSGVIAFEGALNNNLAKIFLGNSNGKHLTNKDFNSLHKKILMSEEIKKILTFSRLKESINSTYKKNLIFVGTKLITLEANKKSGWSFHSDLYLKQRAFDEGCTLWIPLTKKLNDNEGMLSVSILPKHYGFCDPLYKHLHFLEMLEMPFSNTTSNYKKHTDLKLQNLWSEVLSAHPMSIIFNEHCYKFHCGLSSIFLCDKQALINFEYVSKKNNTDCILMGLTFYSEHSVFKYRGLEEEGSNSCILRNINYFINDGLPIIDLPAFKSEPFMRIKSDTIDLNIIKEKFDPRICFD